MTFRNIYTGGIPVAASTYTHFIERNGDYVEVDVESLDNYVTRRTHLEFVLEYPFERPYEGEVRGDGGITLRQIVDAVRAGFRTMYQGATHEQIPGLVNQKVEGTYGGAMHAIGDLVIEIVDVDDEAGLLDIGIGS